MAADLEAKSRWARRPGTIDETLLSSSSMVHDRDAMGGLAPGKFVGRYRVLGRVGVGDRGVVYAARDPQLDRKVALRLLRPHPGNEESTEQAVARVAEEAKLLAEISHPNLISILDIGTHHGIVFVALEFIEGRPLREWMDQGELPHPWPEVLLRFRGVGRGLAAAHRAGFVHRDFRPEKVLVDAEGSARIADLGLARPRANTIDAEASSATRRLRPEDDTSVESLTSPLIRTGRWIGTPAYMAPEQYAGARIDAQADQFAFCVALYEALYGERPFAGRTVQAVMLAIEEGRVRPPSKARRVPAWLRKIVVRGLAHDPESRWPDMDVLLDAIDRRSASAGLGAALEAARSLGAQLRRRMRAPKVQPSAGQDP